MPRGGPAGGPPGPRGRVEPPPQVRAPLAGVTAQTLPRKQLEVPKTDCQALPLEPAVRSENFADRATRLAVISPHIGPVRKDAISSQQPKNEIRVGSTTEPFVETSRFEHPPAIGHDRRAGPELVTH